MKILEEEIRMSKRLYKIIKLSNDQLESCLNDIRNNKVFLWVSVRVYGIPKSTVNNKLKKHFKKEAGLRIVLSDVEETALLPR